jgi:hypothetical protein
MVPSMSSSTVSIADQLGSGVGDMNGMIPAS